MTKTHKIIYWISTVWLSLGMTSSAIAQIVKLEPVAASLTHLGYPLYLLKILGVWKILGVMAILMPKMTRLKEWAYAGFFFVSTGAFVSHVVSGDSFGDTFPSVLLTILTIVSWYFRPIDRKLVHDDESKS